LNIPTFAIVDTNANPKDVDFAIPGNDDAARSIELIVKAMTDAVAEGLAERKSAKGKEEEAPAKEETPAKEEAPAKKEEATPEVAETVEAAATEEKKED
jgi:small subunit ribosomal protein S2